MCDSKEKMYRIAEYLGDLNDSGQVKAVRANQKGYATVRRIVRGCAVVVNLSKDEKFSVNLFISPKAQERDRLITSKAVTTFYQLFQPMVQVGAWTSLRGKSKHDDVDYHRYSVDVSNMDLQEMIRLVDSIKIKYKFSY